MTTEERIKHRREEDELIERAKADLAAEEKLPRNEKFDAAWRLAWDYGHSSGINEVKNYFRELADLIR